MKRLLSIFVAMLMVTTMLVPSVVFADEEQGSQTEVIYTDIIAEKPANFLLNGGVDSTYKNPNYNGGDIIDTTNGVITYKEKANKSESWWGAGTTNVIAANKLEGISYSTEKYYVISARLKNGAPDKNPAIRAGFSYKTGRGTPVWWDVTNTQDFETYTAVFKPNLDGGSSICFGIATNVDRSAYTDDQLGLLLYDYSNGGSLYIAEETAYEVVNEFVGSNEVFAGSAATLKTEVHNQVGIKGNISQNVSYKVLNSERTEEINTITAVANGDGTATITVPEDAQPGEYWVLAIAGNIQSGEMFKVISENTFTDWRPGELDDNLVVDPTNLGAMGWGNTGGSTTTTNMTADESAEIGNDSSSGIRKIKATADYTSVNNWGNSGAQIPKNNPNTGLGVFSFENGTTYVFKMKVKSVEGTPKFNVNISEGYSATGSAYTNEYGIGGYTPGTEYEDFKATITTSSTDKSARFLCIGLMPATAGDTVYINVKDGWYFAKEKAYDIRVTGSSGSVAPGETINLEAAVVNQIETTGKLAQSFDWVVLTEDKTSYADGITFTKTNDGADVEVEVAENVVPGKYIIVAQDKTYGMNRQYPITVTGLNLDTTESSASLTFLGVNATEDVMVVIAAYNGNRVVKASKTVITPVDGVATLSEADVQKLTLSELTAGNKVRVFVWTADDYTPLTMKADYKKPVTIE